MGDGFHVCIGGHLMFMRTVLASVFFAVAGSAAAGAAEPAHQYQNFNQLDGKPIGVLTGTLFEPLVNNTLERTQLEYYDQFAAMLKDLRDGKLEAIVDDEPGLRFVASQDSRYRVLPDRLATYNYAMLFNFDKKELLAEWNAELSAMIASGEIEALVEKWMSGNGGPTADYERYSGTSLVRLSVFTESPPFVFRDMQNNIVGIDIEIAEIICRRLGYRLEVSHAGFDALFDALMDGRADVIASAITIIDERKMLGNFSIPYYQGGAAAMVRSGE